MKPQLINEIDLSHENYHGFVLADAKAVAITIIDERIEVLSVEVKAEVANYLCELIDTTL